MGHSYVSWKGNHTGCRAKRLQLLPVARPSFCWGILPPAYFTWRFLQLLTQLHSFDLEIFWFLSLCIILFAHLFLTSLVCPLLLLDLSQRWCSIVTPCRPVEKLQTAQYPVPNIICLLNSYLWETFLHRNSYSLLSTFCGPDTVLGAFYVLI